VQIHFIIVVVVAAAAVVVLTLGRSSQGMEKLNCEKR